jgi:hypothetical protein
MTTQANPTSSLQVSTPLSLPPFKTPRPVELNEQQATFCKWYALIGKGKEAALKAGYSLLNAKNQSTGLKKRETVRTYIRALQNELATGQTVGAVSREWVVDQYRGMAEVRGDQFTTVENGITRYKRPDELTEVQRLAVREVRIAHVKATYSKEGDLLSPAHDVVTGYDLYDAHDALVALRQLEGMDRQKVQVDHTHRHNHRVAGLFKFVAERQITSETTARLRARHGNAGARVIEHEPQAPMLADQRALRVLKGV